MTRLLSARSFRSGSPGTETRDGYSAPDDFCKIFNDHIEHLYTLAFLLMADHPQAERCVLGALEECLQGPAILKEWMLSWSKRAIIKTAIQIIRPSASGECLDGVDRSAGEGVLHSDSCAAGRAIASAIVVLHPFDRFVYVLSILERYSDRECSLLLDSSVSQIARARERSLRSIAALLTNVDFHEVERRPDREAESLSEADNHEVGSGVIRRQARGRSV